MTDEKVKPQFINDKVAAEYFEGIIGAAVRTMYEQFTSAPGVHAVADEVGALIVARTFYLTIATIGKDEVERIVKEIDEYGPHGANEAEGDGVKVVGSVDEMVKHIIDTTPKGDQGAEYVKRLSDAEVKDLIDKSVEEMREADAPEPDTLVVDPDQYEDLKKDFGPKRIEIVSPINVSTDAFIGQPITPATVHSMRSAILSALKKDLSEGRPIVYVELEDEARLKRQLRNLDRLEIDPFQDAIDPRTTNVSYILKGGDNG